MQIKYNASGHVFVGCAVLFTLISGILYAISLWTESNLEFWLSKYKGEPVDVPFWMALVISLVLNGLTIPINIVSEIISLAL